MDICCSSPWLVVAGLIGIYSLVKWFMKKRENDKLERWNNTPNNTVILHGIFGGRYLPSPSPFVLKLETYLRMANIPYETPFHTADLIKMCDNPAVLSILTVPIKVDKTDPFGPKGKTPWISINKTHIGDSQLAVEYLNKKFEKDLSLQYSEEQRALGLVIRIMMEEHVYWGGVLFRFVYGGKDTLAQVWKGEIKFMEWLFFTVVIAPTLKKMAWSQGLGRHTEEEVNQLMLKDLRALSKILGDKRFLLGDHPSEYDCSVFSFVASAVFVQRNSSPSSALFDGELKNLKTYAQRMKEKYWPDWENRLKK